MKKRPEKICYLIGNPVSHSLSPGMHSIIYSRLEIGWQYHLMEIKTTRELKEFGSRIKRTQECPGFNVTIPHKRAVMKHLDGIDPAAKKIGAVNTVVRNENKLSGANTDWEGFRDDLKKSFPVETLSGIAVVLGAGGAGRAVVYSLLEGFESVPEKVYVYDIDKNIAEKLKFDFKNPAIKIINESSEMKKIISGADILVNTTPVGMKPSPPPIDISALPTKETLIVYDVIYNRSTELVRQAGKKGLKSSLGAGMLARQGARAFELWSGLEVAEQIKKEMEEYVVRSVKAG